MTTETPSDAESEARTPTTPCASASSNHARRRSALGRAESSDRFALKLFDDVGLDLELDSVEVVSDDNVIVNAHVAGALETSSATLVAKNDAIVGNVSYDGHLYEIRYGGRGKAKVRELNPAAPESCDSEQLANDSDDGTGPGAAGEPETAMDTTGGSTLDLLVAYTPSALKQAGSVSAVEAAIQMAVNDTSITYANSGMPHRVRLVHIVALSQAESGNLSTDLGAAKGTSDGKWDEIHSLRTKYGADQVSVVIAGSSSGTVGIGYVGGGKAAAFTVTKIGAFSNLTFTRRARPQPRSSPRGRFRVVRRTLSPSHGLRKLSTDSVSLEPEHRLDEDSDPGQCTYNSVAKL